MLTNFQTIKKSIEQLNFLNQIENDGSINLYTKKERCSWPKRASNSIATWAESG